MAMAAYHTFSPTLLSMTLSICRPCLRRQLSRNSRCLYRSYVRQNHDNPWTRADEEREINIPVGERQLKIKTGHLARFADGCAVAQIGDVSVMVTAVSKEQASTLPFLPLTVDYRQKAAAAGRIPTNYLRRELGATDKEILTSRMIDRSIRPLFPSGFHSETQLVCNLLAVDGVNDPEVASINAASAALVLSDIPWNGPIGSSVNHSRLTLLYTGQRAVRVGLIDGDVVINPTRRQLAISALNLVVSATSHSKVVMLEASGECVSQPNFLKAIKAGVKQAQNIVRALEELQSSQGRPKRALPVCEEADSSVREALISLAETRIRDVFTDSSHHKISRDKAMFGIRDEVLKQLKESFPEVKDDILNRELNAFIRQIFRDLILDTGIRCDGRGLTDLRPINCKVDLYAPLHGSAVFQRGQTQVMSTVTFDSPDSAAKVDTISALTDGVKEKNFFLHYEFPPYATNETGRPGAIGRRELGHGALAEKGLRPVVPSDFPFTIRLTAEVLESNGSSSMASVCSGSLALMDAGVPLSEAAAGVAVGLVTRTDPDSGEISDYKVITDLLGIEDYLGDMDFKMAGTKSGITALQADVKLPGLPLGVVMEAVQCATVGKSKILAIMNQTQNMARDSRKDNSPVTERLEVPAARRARFLGAGGINLRKLKADTGVSVSPVDDSTYDIFAPNQAAMDEAWEKIDELLAEDNEPVLDFGGIYKAKIVEIRDYGIMVQLFLTMSPTLIHNSQLDQRKVSHPSALGMVVGQEVTVKYFGRDPSDGRVRLSRKVLQSAATSVIRSFSKPGSPGGSTGNT